ncbi:hypothetical protein GVAV_000089 [Gurleya vavrai]
MTSLKILQTHDIHYIINSLKIQILDFETNDTFENESFENVDKNNIIDFTGNDLTGGPLAFYIFDHLLYLNNKTLSKYPNKRYQIIIRLDFEQFIFKYVIETINFIKSDLKNFEKSNNNFEDNIPSILAFEASNLFYVDLFDKASEFALKNSDDTKFENVESFIIFDSKNDQIENFHDKFFENLEENEKFLIDD